MSWLAYAILSAVAAAATAILAKLGVRSRGAAAEKSGLVPFWRLLSAISVNWLTTSAAAPVSSRERSKRPSSFSNTRSRATLPASRAASASASPAATPSSTSRPGPISAAARPSTPTEALETRCTTTLMSVATMTDRGSVEAASFPPPLPAELALAYSTQGRPQLGSLLLRDGVVTVEQLEACLTEKEANGGRLGEILVRHGIVSASQVARVLAEQHGLEYLELGRFEVDPAAAGLLPEKVARRLGALPIAFADDAVLIAVADPTDVIASDDLRLALGLQIRLAVVAADDLNRALERSYRTNVTVELEALPEEELGAVEDIRDGGATVRRTSRSGSMPAAASQSRSR